MVPGYPDQALQRTREAQLLAQEIEHPFSLAHALYFSARIHNLRREVPETLMQAKALITLATEHGFRQWETYGTFFKGFALVLQGQDESSLDQMRQGFTVVSTTGPAILRMPSLLFLAEAYGKAGEAEVGLPLLVEARTGMDESRRGDLMAESYRIEGELLLRQATPEVSTAETAFQLAINIACQQEVKSWELRASISLARLWQSQGKRKEAYGLLAPVYEWFTEGFETADLIDAQALLDALAEGSS